MTTSAFPQALIDKLGQQIAALQSAIDEIETQHARVKAFAEGGPGADEMIAELDEAFAVLREEVARLRLVHELMREAGG